jgi:alcohol dehydrogenase class IV
MSTFHYANPSVIHWGQGCVRAKLGNELDRLGAQRVLLVTTASVARNRQLAPAVESLLGQRLAGRFASISQHVPVHQVMEGVEAARRVRADAFVSLGGGSPIDAAKAMAFALAAEVDLTSSSAVPCAKKLGHVLPHLAIPTTLSAAELSQGAGFTVEGTHEKAGVSAPELLAAAVFYDPDLSLSTPLALWLSTGIRAVDHAAETLLAPGEHPLPDVAAVEALRRLKAGLLTTHSDPDNLEARIQCQMGAWFSYLLPGLSARGLSHTLSKRLGSRHSIPHGVSSCLTLPHVLRYLAARRPEPMRRIAEALGAADAADAADAVAQLVAALGLPQHLSAWDLTDDDLLEAVRTVASDEYPESDLLDILRAAS